MASFVLADWPFTTPVHMPRLQHMAHTINPEMLIQRTLYTREDDPTHGHAWLYLRHCDTSEPTTQLLYKCYFILVAFQRVLD